MNENRIFCAECKNDVEYTVTTKNISGALKGENYDYEGQIAHCSECGEKLYVAHIEDANLKVLYDTYRINNGIISLEYILEIPNKYNIGKRPLSLLLGWGELTFTRYCEGDMPSKQYSDILQQIYDNPYFYLELLEKNKENLNSLKPYEKSKKATESLQEVAVKNDTKINLVIGYVLNQCADITPSALQKALYYIQGFYYAFSNSFFFEDDCEAWVHGPVYREIYNRYSSYRFDPIEKHEHFDDSLFSSTEKSILDSIIKNICCYSGKVLELFTHSETPWLKTRGNLTIDVQSNRIISKDLIAEYFNAVKAKHVMLTPNDISDYTKALFGQLL